MHNYCPIDRFLTSTHHYIAETLGPNHQFCGHSGQEHGDIATFNPNPTKKPYLENKNINYNRLKSITYFKTDTST
jgi:hypothetical protein